jgi:hypothetical protein
MHAGRDEKRKNAIWFAAGRMYTSVLRGCDKEVLDRRAETHFVADVSALGVYEAGRMRRRGVGATWGGAWSG